MKMKRTATVTLSLLLFAACCTLSRSCANTTTPPQGGPKDTIPPVLISTTPQQNSTMVPTFGTKILLLFDEYTVVKTATDIVLSPPTKRRPTAKVKGKNIVVTLPDTLKENRTYTIDFGQALADNNEGNPAARFVYAFSTGETVDSLYFTGTVTDSQTLKPVKGATVAIYSDLSDSACFKIVPDALARTDDWGFFTIRNIRPDTFRVFAFTDEDADYKYSPDTDQIAFCDSVFVPYAVVRDSNEVFEFRNFNMKDTLKCKARHSMVTMAMFKELQSVQYLQNSGRKSDKCGFLKFSAGDVQINRLEFLGIDSSAVIIQYSPYRDSLDFWINVDHKLDDSLLIRLNYMKTDSTGNLVPFDENLSLAVMKNPADEAPAMAKESKKEKDSGKADVKKKEKDTVFVLTEKVANETVEDEGFYIESELPVITAYQDSIVFIETNPKGQTSRKKFTFKQDSSIIRRYHVLPTDKLIKGYDYKVTFPQGTFINLDRLPNQKKEVSFKIPQDENLCSIKLNMTGVKGAFIVEIVDEKASNALRTFHISKDTTLNVPYVKAGRYKVRLTQDGNGNGMADTGNLLAHRQPELVKFYERGEGPESQILELEEGFDIEQDIDVKKLFE